ncbi:hypothetical protein MPSEU_000588400 [Mayamaea pseudoterrestris]|nr:hypothetical protein MPSEU_000588400 [Mayamaea pseudoterrestris]
MIKKQVEQVKADDDMTVATDAASHFGEPQEKADAPAAVREFAIPTPPTTNPYQQEPLLLPRLGRHRCPITCPYCHEDTHTMPWHYPDCCTLIVVVLLLVVFWPVCWLPLVLPDCQTTAHRCAKCSHLVGTTACFGR